MENVCPTFINSLSHCTDNCLDKDWLKPNDFTPTGPDELRVMPEVREENGTQVPVLMVTWKARSDGRCTTVDFLVHFRVCVSEDLMHQVKFPHFTAWPISYRNQAIKGILIISIYHLQ